MCLRIFENIPRAQLEAYYSESHKMEWTVPRADLIKIQANKMASTQKIPEIVAPRTNFKHQILL